MMLLIEYVNVATRGNWQNKLSKSKTGQYLLGVILGIIPGCLGAYTVVSLYTHGVLSFGALVATMIATSGDEAYIMLSLFPFKAMVLFTLLSIIGLVTGYLTDVLLKKFNISLNLKQHGFEVHQDEHGPFFAPSSILKQLRKITFRRGLLISILLIFLILLLADIIEFHEEGWVQITLLLVSTFALFVVITVPDHFLEEHLWKHVVKKHLLRIFLWTFGTLLVIYFLQMFLDVDSWVESNIWSVLIIAVLLGIIPESGPHLIFVTLFTAGTIPFSILMASSIVQDGHGTIPLLAVSKKNFAILKIINVIVGLIFGGIGLILI